MPEIVKRTQAELVAEMIARFGEDHKNWAFQCPNCKDVATAQDFKDVIDAKPGLQGVDPFSYLGQDCIGRLVGALSRDSGYATGKYTGRGCDWVAYGLFSGPEFIIMPDGREAGSFPIAPAPTPVVKKKPSGYDICVQCGESRGAIRNEKMICCGLDHDGEVTWEAPHHRFKPYSAEEQVKLNEGYIHHG
jgi:hypothetical protein